MYAAGMTLEITAKLHAYEKKFGDLFPLMFFGGTQQELLVALDKAINSNTPYNTNIPDDVLV